MIDHKHSEFVLATFHPLDNISRLTFDDDDDDDDGVTLTHTDPSQISSQCVAPTAQRPSPPPLPSSSLGQRLVFSGLVNNVIEMLQRDLMRIEPIDLPLRMLQLMNDLDETFVSTDDRERNGFGQETMQFAQLKRDGERTRHSHSLRAYGENESEVGSVVPMSTGSHQLKLVRFDQVLIGDVTRQRETDVTRDTTRQRCSETLSVVASE